MTLRVGTVDTTIGYELRGDLWWLYKFEGSTAPAATDQHSYPTVAAVHDAWINECVKILASEAGSLADAIDVPSQLMNLINPDDVPV